RNRRCDHSLAHRARVRRGGDARAPESEHRGRGAHLCALGIRRNLGLRYLRRSMNADEALAFVRTQGVVLVAGKGPVPRLVEAIAGESIAGSWWGHPQGKLIFATLQSVVASSDVLVCRLVDGKITLVHRRVWPALVRLAARFPRERLAQVHEEHTASGKHETT